LRTFLEDLVRSLRLDCQVEFIGEIPAKAVLETLNGVGLVVSSSISEGLPYAIVEAMARARPVVATRVGGVAELVTDGKTGYVVSPKNPDDLSRAILQVLSDPQLEEQMGRAARERALKDFTFDTMMDLTTELYAHLRNSEGPEES
jgi:glycosyltransferase involved in cell wall biosynthesis